MENQKVTGVCYLSIPVYTHVYRHHTMVCTWYVCCNHDMTTLQKQQCAVPEPPSSPKQTDLAPAKASAMELESAYAGILHLLATPQQCRSLSADVQIFAPTRSNCKTLQPTPNTPKDL